MSGRGDLVRAWTAVRPLVAQAPGVAHAVAVLDEGLGQVEELHERLAVCERELEQLRREVGRCIVEASDDSGPEHEPQIQWPFRDEPSLVDTRDLNLGALTPEEFDDMLHALGCRKEHELPTRLADCWRNDFSTSGGGSAASCRGRWDGLVHRGLAMVLHPESCQRPGVTFGVTETGFQALRSASRRPEAPPDDEDDGPLDPPCKHSNDPVTCTWCAVGEDPEDYAP